MTIIRCFEADCHKTARKRSIILSPPLPRLRKELGGDGGVNEVVLYGDD
ncbi:MAG: hypothetical protein H2048_09290 [Erythrobacter sp.]|jgi:hypothetical protein|nr:hypothetical protein [Erythrobacter sp.]